ncbi:MAG: autotransporter domain-containing protein, partial [Notoacmeibacter sp.]
SAGMGSDANCNKAQTWSIWGLANGSQSNYSGSVSGYDVSGSVGIERDLSAEAACGKRALGAFAFTGGFGSDYTSGKSNGWNGGLGAYARATGDNGFYGSVLGAVSVSNTDSANSIFGSTSSQDATSYVATAALGIVRPLAEQTWVDVRGFAAYSFTDGAGFIDSAGITVDGSSSSVATFGATLGLHHNLTETTKGFLRGGVKWSEAQRSMSAFGIEAGGSSSGTFGTLEAGFESKLNERATLNGSLFGEFGDGSTSIGGKVKLAIKF